MTDIKLNVFSEKVTNYNCDRLCSQKYCDEIYTQFITITLNNVELFIPLCDKHAEEIKQNNGN